MVALKRLRIASRGTQQPPSPAPSSPESYNGSTSRTNIDGEAAARALASLRPFTNPSGWVVTTGKTEPCNGTGESTAESGSLTHVTEPRPVRFHNLPTEIHFHIATYLPDHALYILARHGYSKRVQRAYQAADPTAMRLDQRYLSFEESSIYEELCMRDTFEAIPLPRRILCPFYRNIWTSTVFHCWDCHESVGYAHFPLKEMAESRDRRAGMSKITKRQCFARITPVELWDRRVTTWDELQHAWRAMGDDAIMCVVLSEHGRHGQKQSDQPRCRSSPSPARLTDTANTLQLSDLDAAVRDSPLPWPSSFARQLGVEATAEYYIDLYPLFRLLATDGISVRAQLAQKRPYICPHLDLVALMSRPMASNPIDFRPSDPEYAAHATVADVLCKTLEAAPWRADPSVLSQRASKPLRRIKEQTIWCGFKGNKCRTAVSLQRFRDSSGKNSVGGLWGLSDLCRIKVVRRWRVDCGTGDDEWRAQNGVSVPASKVL